jgi:hypothetical protein
VIFCRVTIATVWLICEMRQRNFAEPFVHAGPILVILYCLEFLIAPTSSTWLRSCDIRSLRPLQSIESRVTAQTAWQLPYRTGESHPQEQSAEERS